MLTEKCSSFSFHFDTTTNIHRLGTIRTYCSPHVEQGISLLQLASSSGYVPAHYSLGLILRDTAPAEAEFYMQQAFAAQYFPALQEVLSDTEMKKRAGTGLMGDVDNENLLAYMDPGGLSRLLCRHYCFAKRLRMANTSHCWNPKCGRWAFRCNSHNNKIICHHHHHHHNNDNDDDEDDGTYGVVVVGVSRMKVCSRCCRAKYCSKLCQVYDWRSGRHQTECQYLM
jgi:MYND finger